MPRHPRTKITALALAGAVIASLLAACGNHGNDKTFTYWSMWQQGEDQQKVLSAAFAEFTRQTGIKVKVQWAGREVLSQVLPRLTAGDPPDLIDQGGTDILGALGPVNGVQGLADVYASKVDGEYNRVDQVIPSRLISSFKASNGQPFIVPYEVVGSTVWNNAKRDPKLASESATWSQFLAALDALKTQGRTPLALDGDVKDYDGYWMVWSLLRIGGPGLLTRSAKDGTGAAFDDPAWQQASDAIEHLIQGGYFPKDFTATKFPTQQTAWADGSSKTDVLLMGNWAPSETSAALSKAGKNPASTIEYGSFPFPSFGPSDKGDGVVEAGPIGFAIPKKARHADAAKKFLLFFLNKERLAKISTVAKNLTPRADITAPPELADYAKEFKNGKTYVAASDNLAVTAPKWLTDIWQPTVADFFAGKMDAAGFVQTLKAKTIKLHKNGG